MRKIDFPKILIYITPPLLLLGGLTWGVSSCRASAEHKIAHEENLVKHTFTLPDIPTTLTDHTDRANYLTLHYWDHFNFSDTANIHLPGITEQAFVDFLDVLTYTEYESAVKGIQHLLHEAEKETSGRMYGYFLDLFDKYLYNPNSPYRNEEYYIPVAEYILTDSRSGEFERMVPENRLERMRKNRIGEIANDIAYTLADGNTGNLHRIRTEYTLLYFNNPDCNACEETADALKGSGVINSLLDNGTLTILAICPDEDLTGWKRHHSHIPDDWINGYDKEKEIRDKNLYDMKAIPSLYLLDKEKRVLLKDVDFIRLESWLGDQFSLLTSN